MKTLLGKCGDRGLAWVMIGLFALFVLGLNLNG